MLDETRVLLLLEDHKKEARTLSDKTNLTPEEFVELGRLNDRIDLLKLIVGEDRKKELFLQLKEMKITDIEVIKGSIYVLEQILIARGFTNKEEIQKNLLAVIKLMRGTQNAPTP